MYQLSKMEKSDNDRDNYEYEEDTDGDDQQRLSSLLSEIRELHEEFNSKSLAWDSVFTPNLLHVSDAMRKVYELAELVPQVCPKDRAACWKHEADLANGVVNEAFERLKKTSHAAYVAIQSTEPPLELEQATVKKIFEVTQDLVARLEDLEGKSDSFLASMKDLQASSEERLAENEENKRVATERFNTAKMEAYDAEKRIRWKHDVNSNVFSGIADWFSRSDVCISSLRIRHMIG